jgi:predicted transcriptional regulator
VGRSKGVNTLKKRTAYNTTLDSELMKKIKILAARLDKRQNDLIEKAIKEFIIKYEHKASSPSLPN